MCKENVNVFDNDLDTANMSSTDRHSSCERKMEIFRIKEKKIQRLLQFDDFFILELKLSPTNTITHKTYV